MSTPDDEYRALLEDREGIITALRTRIAELEAIIERTNKHEAHRLKVERHNATEDALRWADKHRGVYTSGRADTSDEWVDRGLKALLGNNETNTNNQGEINA